MAPNARVGYGACMVYCICNTLTGEQCYVGSTALPRQVRMGMHYQAAFYRRTSDWHKHMWATGLDNFEMRTLEGPFACASQLELSRHEEVHRARINPRFNMRKACT